MLCCGNTGCLMAGGTIRLRTLKGLKDQHYVLFGLVRATFYYLMRVPIIPSPSYSSKRYPRFQLCKGCTWLGQTEGRLANYRH